MATALTTTQRTPRSSGTTPLSSGSQRAQKDPRWSHSDDYENSNNNNITTTGRSSSSRRRVLAGPAVRREIPQQQQQPNNGNFQHSRPRPISTGRLYGHSNSIHNNNRGGGGGEAPPLGPSKSRDESPMYRARSEQWSTSGTAPPSTLIRNNNNNRSSNPVRSASEVHRRPSPSSRSKEYVTGLARVTSHVQTGVPAKLPNQQQQQRQHQQHHSRLPSSPSNNKTNSNSHNNSRSQSNHGRTSSTPRLSLPPSSSGPLMKDPSYSDDGNDDPHAVTQAILDLREKREQAQSRRLQRESLRNKKGRSISRMPIASNHIQEERSGTRAKDPGPRNVPLDPPTGSTPHSNLQQEYFPPSSSHRRSSSSSRIPRLQSTSLHGGLSSNDPAESYSPSRSKSVHRAPLSHSQHSPRTTISPQQQQQLSRNNSSGSGSGSRGSRMRSSKKGTDPIGLVSSSPSSAQHRFQFYQPEHDIPINASNLSSSAATVGLASPEEVQATKRLEQAESKISNLMSELDELRFFHEIEVEKPSTSKSESPAAGPSTPKSPLRTTPLVSVNSYNHLSPRGIARLNRHELELEVQTLIRDYKVMETERSSLHATVEMAEASHEEGTQRIHTLESALSKVQKELSRSMEDVHKGRAQLTEQFQDRLAVLQTHLDQSQMNCNGADRELRDKERALEDLHDEYGRLQQEHVATFTEESQKQTQKDSEYEQQLAKYSLQLKTANGNLEERDEMLVEFGVELKTMEAELKEAKTEKDAAYEVRISGLERQLSVQTKNMSQLQKSNEKEVEEAKEIVSEMMANEEGTEQVLQTLREELVQVKEEYETKLQDWKRVQEDKEGKRLNMLVGEQQEKVQEYEHRLKNLQEQLTLSRDRHINDIEQKDVEMKNRLEEDTAASVQRVREDYEKRIDKLKIALTMASALSETQKDEGLRTQMESETKGRDAAREYKRLNVAQKGELERVNERLDRTALELGEKESKVNVLLERLTSSEERNQSALIKIEAQHAEELTARDEIVSTQRQRWNATESKMRIELARKESALMTMQDTSDNGAAELQDELSKTRKELANAQKAVHVGEVQQLRMNSLHTDLENMEQELALECARHGDVEADWKVEHCELQGKLSAAEVAIKQKRSSVEELELRISQSNDESSKSVETLQAEIVQLNRKVSESREMLDTQQNVTTKEKGGFIGQLEGLKRELFQSRNLLENERVANKAKDFDIGLLQEELEAGTKGLSNMVDLQGSVTTLSKSLVERTREKIEQEAKFSNLQLEHEETSEKLRGMKQLVDESNVASTDSAEMTKEMRDQLDGNRSTIAKLEEKLQSRTEATSLLQVQIHALKNELDNAIDQSMSRKKDSEKALQLEGKLLKSERSKYETYNQLEELQREKNDMDDAVEQLITEMQHRDHELDALTEVLEKRDEELDHAKLIATRAIASAQEIKTYYTDQGLKSPDRAKQKEYKQKLEDLNRTVGVLSGENDQLANETAEMEKKLVGKDKEIARLIMKVEGNEPSTKPVTSPQGLNDRSSDSFEPMFDTNGFMALGDLGEGQNKLQPFPKKRSNQQHPEDESDIDASARVVSDSMSTNTAAMGEATKWFHDFDSNSASKGGIASLDGTKSEPGLAKSRRSIERDALKKYVRKRYEGRRKEKESP